MQTQSEVSPSKRLQSIDALRGFDMFFITGGAALITALCTAFGCGTGWLAQQMRHVPWEGFAQHDTIFPLFLFLAGVSWPFSLASQQARGRSAAAIHVKVLIRMVVFFLIEVSLGGLLKFNPNFRLMGVLSYIGISWGVAALLFLHVRKFSHRILIVAALLVGYWALLRFGHAPDAAAGADTYAKAVNIIGYLDRRAWPNHLLERGITDPESFFSLPGGIALALIGTCAGAWLRRTDVTPAKKSGALALAAVVLLLLDLVFTLVLGDKIVKRLWTSSFVLSAATYSMTLLALFYWLIDVRGWRRWTLYFRVIGMNSIFIYLTMRLGYLSSFGRFFTSGLAEWVGAPWSGVVTAVGMLSAGWAVLYFLYRKNVFLKV